MRLYFYGDYKAINEAFPFIEANFYKNVFLKGKVMT